MPKNKLLREAESDYEISVSLPVATFKNPEIAKLYEGASRYATHLLFWMVCHEYVSAHKHVPYERTIAAHLYRQNNLILHLEQPLLGDYLVSTLVVDESQLTLSAGRYAARWTRTKQGYSLAAVGGLYPAGAHGWETGEFIPVSKGHYNELPRTYELLQDPSLSLALEFDRYQTILSDPLNKLPHPDSFIARPFDEVQPKPDIIEF